MSSAVDFLNVSVGYHGKPVIEGLTLSIQAGEMVAVLGPNGAGKTTLLRCLTGLCRPALGTVRVFGRDLAEIPAGERARIMAVVPQELETPTAFSVQEIVMIGRTSSLGRWGRPSKHDHTVVERAMVYTDVASIRDRPFGELSGGEKQRAIVAMALAQEPRLILMDEATSHLDMNHRLEVMQIVERLNREQGMTVLTISHDLNLSAEFCPRIILMDRGRIVADGSPAAVLTEETLRQVYHCDVRVQPNPASGSVCVMPAPRLAPGRSGKGIRIHVVAGGGCGEDVLRPLSLCEYSVTCGVLNAGDTDTSVCEALDIRAAIERPFSPVGAAALAEARAMVAEAAVVIVCGVPFGPGNVANLDLAEQALAAGRRVLVMEGVERRDYSSAHEATDRIRKLVSAGALEWRNITDLLNALPVADNPPSSPTRP